jgi:REP element-mobilizing transposase RayT
MNNRDYKLSGENAYFHVYNRGNRKESIFFDDEDYNFFLLRLKQNLYPEIARPRRMEVFPADSFSLIAYCLMPNHFHLVIRQNREFTISQLLLKIATSYSKYFNKKYNKVGHVFQDQFKQKIIEDDAYLQWLSAYVHQNPCLDNLAQKPQEYRWSSYQEYLSLNVANKTCDKNILVDAFGGADTLINFTETNLEILKSNKDTKKFSFD